MRDPRRSVRFPPLQRRFPAGATIEVRVTRPYTIGKFTRIVVRRYRVPRRTDRCLAPGVKRPSRCPRR